MAQNSKTRVKISKIELGEFVGFKTVWGWSTRSKYLAVTPQLIPGSRWKAYKSRFAITHIPTGATALKHFSSVRQAQLCSVVLAAMPLKLLSITVKNSRRRREKLDPKFISWLEQWHGEDAVRGASQ